MFMRFTLAIAACVALATSTAHAHFPWLNSDSEGRALLYFAESPLETDYRMPKVVADAKVHLQTDDQKAREIELKAIDTKQYVGRQSEANVAPQGVLTTTCDYGNYHGTQLRYYVKHYAGQLGKALQAEPETHPTGFAIDARPKLIEKGLAITVLREGEPVKAVGVTVIDSEGHSFEKKADAQGVAKFYNLKPGKLGFIIGVTDKEAGEVNGQAYESTSHYLTLTLTLNTVVTESKDEPVDTGASTQPAQASALAPLPEGVASFGAAVADGYVYVYSGHNGTAHSHSREHYSRAFRRISLDGGKWQELPFDQPLQGLALVPYDGKVYRVGGMFSHNAKDDAEDMHSVDTFAVFDPATNEWTELRPLPEPRSSHDAVVVDGWLYVVGGWNLAGGSDGDWHDTAWKIDLKTPDAIWVDLPKPTFLRRALTVSFMDDTLIAIGGIDEVGDISRQVDALDLETGQWRTLPELPGDGMQGFGATAWNHQGKLYASGSSGVVLQLADDASKWLEAARLADARFFHRLLPAGENRLLALAGHSLSRKSHVADSEWVQLESK